MGQFLNIWLDAIIKVWIAKSYWSQTVSIKTLDNMLK